MKILALNLSLEEMMELTGLTEDQLYTFADDSGRVSLFRDKELEEISRDESKNTRTVRAEVTYIVPPNAARYEVEDIIPNHKDGWSMFSFEETRDEPIDWEAHFKARAERYDHWLFSMFPINAD